MREAEVSTSKTEQTERGSGQKAGDLKAESLAGRMPTTPPPTEVTLPPPSQDHANSRLEIEIC